MAEMLEEQREEKFTGIEWLGVATVGFGIIALIVIAFWVIPVFEKMFREFGNIEIPAPTMIAFKGFYKGAFVFPLGLLVLSLFPSSMVSIQKRRIALITAFVLQVVIGASAVISVYLPIFLLPDAIAP